MDIEDIRNEFISLNNCLTKKQKRYLHFKSFWNFVFHFEELPDERIRQVIIKNIIGYLEEIEENNYDYTAAESYGLIKYMDKISTYYHEHLKFKRIMTLNIVIGIGLLGDSLLWVLDILKNLYYVPVITISLLIYHIAIKIFFEKSEKIYGLFY